MLNIIDSGMDKTVIGFSKEINLLSKKIISAALSNKKANIIIKDNIYQTDFFLPVNTLRNYLKPNFSEFKSLSNENESAENILDIFESYIRNFNKNIYYFFV
jgi:hypothetical protein